MKGPSNLDSSNLVIASWIYLDGDVENNNMRTIFSNKNSGCGNRYIEKEY
jgi:hypothetical protein